jgi:outer membrane protein assembly factor BamD (BamD/ComL family)
LREQTALLDRSRARVGAGDPSSALTLLDDYDRRFARAPLAEESNLIRIEALVRRGDRGAASALARRFLRTYPASVHVARVTALLHALSP